MRILFISNLYPPHYLGGYEIAAARNAEALRAAGMEIAVLTSSAPVETIERAGARPEEPDCPDDVPVTRKLVFLPPAYVGFPTDPEANAVNRHVLNRELERFQPDLIWVWNPTFLGDGLFAVLRDSRIPTALFISDLEVAALAHLPHDLPTAFPSKALLEASGAYGFSPARATVLPHWVDMPATAAACEGNEILFTGRFSPDKGVDTLIEAASLLRHDFLLTLVGQGSVEGIMAQALRLGIQNRVVVIGPVARLDPWYLETAIAALPSRLFEAQALTPLEAMSWGVPTVTTGLGGNACYFDDADGPMCCRVPPGEPAALATVLEELLRSRPLRLEWGRRGREAVRARFSREAVLPLMQAWLERCAS